MPGLDPIEGWIKDKLTADGVVLDLVCRRYALREHAAMRAWLGSAWAGWSEFSESWNDPPEDRYMADGGRYRRRRFAVFDGRRGNHFDVVGQT